MLATDLRIQSKAEGGAVAKVENNLTLFKKSEKNHYNSFHLNACECFILLWFKHEKYGKLEG